MVRSVHLEQGLLQSIPSCSKVTWGKVGETYGMRMGIGMIDETTIFIILWVVVFDAHFADIVMESIVTCNLCLFKAHEFIK